MSSSFYLEILAPGRKFYEGNIESLILPSSEGQEGILQGHIPIVMSLIEGEVKILANGQWRDAVIGGGFAEVERERVVIMTDSAEWPEEIDINRAQAAKERAEERLAHHLSQIEYLRSKAALARALARIKANKKIIK